MKSKVWMILLLMGILLMSGCKKSDENNVKSGNEIPAIVTTEKETQEEQETAEETQEITQEITKEKDIMYIIQKIDVSKQEIRLQNTENGRIIKYGISDATSYRDKYGDFTGISNMIPGRIVTIGPANSSGNLSYIQLSDKAWEQADVERFEIDTDRKIITIGKTKYYYDESLLVFLDEEQISLDMITETDRLRVSGIDKKIASVFVTSGHGYLKLTHTDLFEGGWLTLGNRYVFEVEKDMEIEVAEGTYELSVANDGYGDTKNITVVKNETTVVNLEEYKGAGPKMGTVQFRISPADAVIKINGQQIDPTLPAQLRYGIYELVVTSPEYGEFKEKLVVSSSNAEVAINLEQLAQSEEGGSSSNGTSTSNASDSSSSSKKNTSSSNTNKKNTSKDSDSNKKNNSDSKSDTETSDEKSSSDSKEDLDESDMKKLSDFISTLLD